MHERDLKKGDLVQLNPKLVANKMFASCFMVVTEPKPWGAQGYVQSLGAEGSLGGQAFYRAGRQRATVKDTKWGRYAEVRCKADYFDDREAVTFNTDGFIGFAGWADNTNVQPILEGFKEWVREMKAAKEIAA